MLPPTRAEQDAPQTGPGSWQGALWFTITWWEGGSCRVKVRWTSAQWAGQWGRHCSWSAVVTSLILRSWMKATYFISLWVFHPKQPELLTKVTPSTFFSPLECNCIPTSVFPLNSLEWTPSKLFSLFSFWYSTNFINHFTSHLVW